MKQVMVVRRDLKMGKGKIAAQCCHAVSYTHLDVYKRQIELWIRKHHDDVDLCVLDSAVALYRVNDMKASRLNKELVKQMVILAKIARNYDVAVVLTNQIYSSFDDDNKDVVKACLLYTSRCV